MTNQKEAQAKSLEIEEDKTKKNVLWLSGAPQIATGFATVARNLLETLYATGKYDFTIVGINYLGDYYDQKKYPYKIYPAKIEGEDYDIYGRQRLLDFLQLDVWDLVFTLYDPFILVPLATPLKALQRASRRRFKWLGYFAVDAPQDKEWVLNCPSKVDYPVAYCQYGFDEMVKHDEKLKEKLRIIHHGVNPEDFFPVGPKTKLEFRRRYLKGMCKDDDFLVVNVNRHQLRKDIMRTMLAFREFKKVRPKSFLYLHMKPNDLGGSLFAKAKQLGLKPGVDFAIPGNFSEYVGVPIHILNMIYNIADATISTTTGEGFGLSSIESMATKTLCIMPDNTSLHEILGEGRGLPIKCGTTLSEWCNMGGRDKDRWRPLVNVDDMVKQLIRAYDQKEERKAIEEKAYKWAMERTWDKITLQFVELFDQAVKDLEQERETLKKKIGRNEPCPICLSLGKKIKWKKCKEHNPTVT